MGDWSWNPATDTVVWSENLYAIMGLDSSLPPPGYEDNIILYHPDVPSTLCGDITRLQQVLSNLVGMDGYVAKPIEWKELKKVLDQMIADR